MRCNRCTGQEACHVPRVHVLRVLCLCSLLQACSAVPWMTQFKIAAFSVDLQLFGYLVVTASWDDAGAALCQALLGAGIAYCLCLLQGMLAGSPSLGVPRLCCAVISVFSLCSASCIVIHATNSACWLNNLLDPLVYVRVCVYVCAQSNLPTPGVVRMNVCVCMYAYVRMCVRLWGMGGDTRECGFP